jgi:type II secretory pathway component PulJ
MPQPRETDGSGYRLDDEQRARVRDCLAKAGQRGFEQLTRKIEVSIDQFCRAEAEGTFREAHDTLRELWELSHVDDPPVAVLRARIQALPRQAIEYLDRRVQIVIARLFPTDPPVTRFLEWAGTADRAKLVAATRVLSADGGRIVKGRSRGSGKRSGLRLEPMIMGEMRGAGARHGRGGRPRNAKHQALIMHLAMDWTSATGEAPKSGRSDYTGFGELVHSIFQWLDLPGGSSAQALRRYWADVKESKKRPKLENFLKRQDEQL